MLELLVAAVLSSLSATMLTITLVPICFGAFVCLGIAALAR